MVSELDKLCADKGVFIACKPGRVKLPEGFAPGSYAWRVTLTYEGRSMTAAFYQGPAHKDAPSAADVLSCLCSDARAGDQTFEDFCSDMGLDTDSRKAEKTWRACKATGPRVYALLGHDFDVFASAEH
jgi:hypothetical protein